MTWVPDEQRRYRGWFFGLSLALAAVAVWVIADETWVRRPWKGWQAQWVATVGEAEAPGVVQINVPSLGALDRCPTCHLGIDDPRGEDPALHRVLRAHPRREELLGAHPVERFGCTSCHRGQGPALTADEAHGVGAPDWPNPMLPLNLVEASCVRCHPDDDALGGAPVASRGRRLFGELGCGGCHAVADDAPAASGPPLGHVGSKMQVAALVDWIREPARRRAGAVMPRAWQVGDPRAAAESAAIAAYLLSQPGSFGSAGDLPDVSASARGPAIFKARGCVACHDAGAAVSAGAGTQGGASAAPADDAWAAFGDGGGEVASAGEAPAPIDFGPSLAEIGARLRFPFLVAWLRDPRAYSPSTPMPRMRLAEEEVQALASWLSTLGAPGAPPVGLDDPALVAEGGLLVRRHGCYGCHDIPGLTEAGRPGPDLTDYGGKSAQELFFGDVDLPPAERTWARYTELKISNPMAFATVDIEQWMPTYELAPDEVHALVTWLAGLQSRRPPAAWVAAPQVPSEIALAERIVQERNCKGCHTLDERPGDVTRFVSDTSQAPPDLTHEGARVQPQWLLDFLLAPREVRPWLDLRMPDFGLSEREALALVSWFADRDGLTGPLRPLSWMRTEGDRSAEAGFLFIELKCASCHTAGGAGVSDLAPDLQLAASRLQPSWVRRFLLDPQALLPGTRMPQFFPGGVSPYPERGAAGDQVDLLVDRVMRMEAVHE